MPKIGDAYVQIHAKAEGIKGEIENILDPAAESVGGSAGGKAGKSFMSKLGGAVKVGGAAVAAASAAVGTAVVGISKQAIESYGEYEQLAGGAELMFGKGYDYIAQHAQDAYKTVQMSQNEYLGQVNGFAVGLKTALGDNEQAAAELADKIVTTEADIVAATGNSAESVQNAFNGVMKGNYSMLDNLGLGINATKEGMQEVIDKMNEVNGTDYSIDNVADAQQALIDYVKYCGMAGYAAAEGSETIQGSVATMKSAWDNFLTGLADPDADVGQLADNLIKSIVGENGEGGVFNTIMPVLEQTISSIVDNLPAMLDSLIPVVLDLLQKIVDTLIEHAPEIIEAGFKLVIGLGTGLIKAIPTLVKNLPQIIKAIFNGIKNGVKEMASAGKELISGLWRGISERTDWIKNKIKSWVGNVTGFLKKLFGIGSPSKVFEEEIGHWLPEGAAVGVEKNVGVFQDALSKMGGSVDLSMALTGNAYRTRTAKTNNATATSIADIRKDLGALGQAINGMKVVMSTGELVGAISTPMDNALGAKQALKKRGLIA